MIDNRSLRDRVESHNGKVKRTEEARYITTDKLGKVVGTSITGAWIWVKLMDELK